MALCSFFKKRLVNCQNKKNCQGDVTQRCTAGYGYWPTVPLLHRHKILPAHYCEAEQASNSLDPSLLPSYLVFCSFFLLCSVAGQTLPVIPLIKSWLKTYLFCVGHGGPRSSRGLLCVKQRGKHSISGVHSKQSAEGKQTNTAPKKVVACSRSEKYPSLQHARLFTRLVVAAEMSAGSWI